LAADEERSTEAKNWREWTGIGNLYNNLKMVKDSQVKRIDFLESFIPDYLAVFHYVILLYIQVKTCEE